MIKSAYIHIPFCKKKCKYCSFVSFEKENLITGYVYSLLKEISENYRYEELNTLYFGGGTPSILPVELVEKLIKKFKLLENAEVTFEVNPDDANLEYFEGLHSIGINRISIGVQTFDDNILKMIGRRHNSEQIKKAIEYAKKADFDNISADLIYGLPNQTVAGLKKDLEKFLNLNIQHISTYGLKIEEGSFWGNNPPNNIPNDDVQADMYELINEVLEINGFYRYEISNFSKKGFESRHNLNYWNNDEYYGFGVSAHGYSDGVRYSNFCNLDKYMETPCLHEFGKFMTEKERLEEEIFLGFRKTDGINAERIKTRYNIDFEQKYKKILSKYSDYIFKTQQGYALNLKGVLLSNIILADFIE